MLLELPIPIVQHRDGEDHIDAFNDFLSIENPTQGIFCSAYVTQKGIRAISSGLLKVAHVSDLYVGVRNGVTSKQAILAAMDLGMTAHIVDTGTPKFIFHYKFYYLANENAARAIIGSANLTGAGLEDNVELSNRLNLDFELYGIDRVDAYLSTTMEWLRYTREENVYQVEDEAHLDRLVDNRILVDENHGKKRRREGVDKKATKLVWDVPVMRFETKKRAVVTRPPNVSKIGDMEQVWRSRRLTHRSLNISTGENTHTTGAMLLGMGAWKGIDHQHYFRDEVFAALDWTADAASAMAHMERTEAAIRLIIEGVDFGEHMLQISHNTRTDTASYAQRNGMTNIRWGTALPHIANEKLIGKTLEIFKSDNNTFVVQIA